ncbi:MAG: hypothetical protein RLZZ156_1014 [Deinococcota bacterium]|jgi:antitoxin (DNA-binding transcriptional repressor) of toxin-antitoxin stability system
MTLEITNPDSQLTALLDRIAHGEEVVLTRDGFEVARVSPIHQNSKPNRIGFLEGEIQIGNNFDTTSQEMIDSLAKPTLKELLLSDQGRTDFLIPQRGHVKRRKIEVIE